MKLLSVTDYISVKTIKVARLYNLVCTFDLKFHSSAKTNKLGNRKALMNPKVQLKDI